MERKFLWQGVDYLNFLRTQLQSLQGFKTTCFELLQNADDAKASWIRFDFSNERLIVSNSSTFKGCDDIESDICIRKRNAQGAPCDFHRMRDVASAGKRDEDDTIGTFGIGFISVYGFTDSPEIHSQDTLWQLRPDQREHERIEVLNRSFYTDDRSDHTRIVIPWAFKASRLRDELEQSILSPEQIGSFQDELVEELPHILLFVKHVRRIEVWQNGELVKWTACHRHGDTYEIENQNGERHKWIMLRGRFDAAARVLRDKFNVDGRNLIFPKKTEEVTIAYSAEPQQHSEGRVFAFLPTEMATRFNFHINADFFPVPDRKHIELDGTKHKVEWNKAALDAAAELFADKMRELARDVGHELFYRSLFQIFDQRNDTHLSRFWSAVKDKAAKSRVVYSSSGKWLYPDELRFTSDKVELGSLDVLSSLGIETSHTALANYGQILREFRVQRLSFEDVSTAVLAAKLDGILLESAPQWLSSRDHRYRLYRLVDFLVQRSGNATQNLGALPLGVSTAGRVRALRDLFDAERKDVLLFDRLDLSFADREAMFADELLVHDHVPKLSIFEVIKAFRNFSRTDAKEMHQWLDSLGTKINDVHFWLHRNSSELDAPWRKALADLAIYPTGNTFRPLSNLMIPSAKFKDPFNLAEVVKTTGIYREVISFWKTLGAREIDWSSLITTKLCPYINSHSEISESSLREVVEGLADSFEEIRTEREALRALEDCRLILCTDGIRRQPGQVYFDAVEVGEILGASARYVKESAVGDSKQVHLMLGSLGVEHRPRIYDVCERVRQIVLLPPSRDSLGQIRKIYSYFDEHFPTLDIKQRNDFAQLRFVAWLPERTDKEKWYKPFELFTKANAKLFESQGKFVDFPELRKEARELLGIKDEPTVDLVKEHLLYCQSRKQSVSVDVYKYLQRELAKGSAVVADLRTEKCIDIGGGDFRRPSELFWKPHRMGRWRFTLADEKFKACKVLLNELGVKDGPNALDYRDVVISIGQEFGSKNLALDEQASEVLHFCFSELAAIFKSGQKPFDLAALKSQKIIPNDKQGILFKPCDLLFKDKQRYLQLIGGDIEQRLIKKEERTAVFFTMLGVRSLSKAVVREPHISGAPKAFPELSAWLKELEPLVRQVMLQGGTAESELPVDLFENLSVLSVDSILEALYLPVDNARRLTVSQPLPTTAYFDESQTKLYVVGQDYNHTDLAHQFSLYLDPEIDSFSVVPQLEGILRSDSFEDAEKLLHGWGYDVVISARAPIVGVEGAVATNFGNEEERDADHEDSSPPSNAKTPSVPPVLAAPKNTSPSAQGLALEAGMTEAAPRESKPEDNLDPLHPDVSKSLTDLVPRRGGAHQPLPEPRASGNPQRRKQRLAGEILDDRASELPEEMRYVYKVRKVWRDTGSRVRSDLLAWYDGKCQICDSTFPTGGNKPFFQAHNILKSKKIGDWIDRGANCLCLCANHAAQFEFGYPAVNLTVLVQQLRGLDLAECKQYYGVDVVMVGELQSVTFTHDHIQHFQLLVKTDEELMRLAEDAEE